NPRAQFRVVSPRFFRVLGLPLIAGRDFTDEDRRGSELVAIVSQSLAQRLFPNGDALNRHMWWIDDYFGKVVVARRIVRVVAGVLAFSVSARTREFGIRLAVGSAPRHILARVLSEGVVIASVGIATGAAGGFLLARIAERFFDGVQLPGALPIVGATAVLIG